MAQVHRVKWTKRGPAAISAAVFGLEFDVPEPEAVVDDAGTAVVDVRGPLLQYGGFFCDGYDAILCRAQAAFDSTAKTVLLKINSPGGDVYGNLECARALRAMADASGKAFESYVDGQATSAAYALACAADRIILPETACVGSIGVIDTVASTVRQINAMGIDVALITSGARKADGNPAAPITDAVLAAQQAHVDELAGILHAWVAERRPLSAEQIAGFECGIFTGASAVAAGLADEVLDFHVLRENLAHGTLTAPARNVPGAKNQMPSPKSSKYTDCMAALAALAEEGDEDAKKAIRSMTKPAKAADKADSSAPPAKSSAPSAKSSAPPAAIAAAAAVPAPQAVAPVVDLEARKEVIELRNKLAAKEEAEERSTLLATRPDLTKDPKTSAWLAKAPMATVREAVASLPVITAPAAAAATGTPTRGDTEGNAPSLPIDQSNELKIRMGLAPVPVAATTLGGHYQIVFGGTPEQAKEAFTRGRAVPGVS